MLRYLISRPSPQPEGVPLSGMPDAGPLGTGAVAGGPAAEPRRPPSAESEGAWRARTGFLGQRLLAGALEIVFPARCAVCDAYGSLLCAPCREALPQALPPRCSICWGAEARHEVCPSCQGARPAFQGARAPYRYDGPVRQLLWAFKYDFVMALAAPLAALMAQYVEEHRLLAPNFDVLVPVPLHPRRQRERGYNQAAILARELSRLLGRPWDEVMLRRARAGPPQARSASIEARQRNVVGAFVADAQRAPGRRVLLVDDVMTSGATLNACAQALKDAGAASVWALTIARD